RRSSTRVREPSATLLLPNGSMLPRRYGLGARRLFVRYIPCARARGDRSALRAQAAVRRPGRARASVDGQALLPLWLRGRIGPRRNCMAATVDKRAQLTMEHWGAAEPQVGCDYYTF